MKLIPKIYKSLPKGVRKKTNKLYKYLPRSKKTITKTIDGITYELDLSTIVHSQIYHYGCWEEDVTNIINKTLHEGMVTFDIGASTGPHTLRMAKLVGESGMVYAFEPSKALFPKLKKGIKLNAFENVTVENLALSDTEEVKSYYMNTLFKLGDKEDIFPAMTTLFVTLDDYVKQNKIKKIDFIKLDVDGYETKIIKGGFKSIKKFKPIMIIEFAVGAQESYGYSLEELADILISLGYTLFDINTLKEYENVLKVVPKAGSINVLCVHPRKIMEQLGEIILFNYNFGDSMKDKKVINNAKKLIRKKIGEGT